MCEPADSDLFKGKGVLGLQVPDGTNFEQAKSIAEYLNENIVAISYTRLPPD
jgi:hypothetical protein